MDSPAFRITEIESDLTWFAIHIGLVFFVLGFAYLMWLRPETRIEKAITANVACLALVFIRVVEYRYFPGFSEASWFGAAAWSLLLLSFIYTFYVITSSSFGRKGRIRRERTIEALRNKGNELG